MRKTKRITKRYSDCLDAIARIFLEENEHPTPTARRVVAELGLRSFKPFRFNQWSENPQWIAALEAARKHLSLKSEFGPEVRGSEFIGWLRERLAEMKTAHADAKAEETEEGNDKARVLENRILDFEAAARAEERHLADIRLREAQADMRKFATRLLKDLAECGLPEHVQNRLKEIARKPSMLLDEE